MVEVRSPPVQWVKDPALPQLWPRSQLVQAVAWIGSLTSGTYSLCSYPIPGLVAPAFHLQQGGRLGRLGRLETGSGSGIKRIPLDSPSARKGPNVAGILAMLDLEEEERGKKEASKGYFQYSPTTTPQVKAGSQHGRRGAHWSQTELSKLSIFSFSSHISTSSPLYRCGDESRDGL